MEILNLTFDLIKYKTVSGNNKSFDECFNYIENYLSDTKLKILKLE